MREQIRAAAIRMFKDRGYHGASMRDLARDVGINPASLYFHYPSKQHILYELFKEVMQAMIDGFTRSVVDGSTPDQRLRAFVRFHVLIHVARRDELFISHAEIRSLTADNRRRIVAMRDRYEKMLRALLTAGVRGGAFALRDVALTSTAILMMCSGVSDWYTSRGRFTAEQVADRYVDLVIRLVRA